MAEIIWTDEAVHWLKEIHNFIKKDNPGAAFETVRGIYDKIQILKEFPQIGKSYSLKPDSEVRILLFDHYRIAYRHKESRVEILGIFHGSMDIDRFLK